MITNTPERCRITYLSIVSVAMVVDTHTGARCEIYFKPSDGKYYSEYLKESYSSITLAIKAIEKYLTVGY